MSASAPLDNYDRFTSDFLDLAATGNKRGMGTPAENSVLPIHRWYRFPAAFSASLVDTALRHFAGNVDLPVLDPFGGVGTTAVTAQLAGRPSVSFEAHSYLSEIATAKIDWRVNPAALRDSARGVLADAARGALAGHAAVAQEPEMVRKCYSFRALSDLLAIRTAISDAPARHRRHLKVALAETLRTAADVYVRSPYTAYGKRRQPAGSARDEFRRHIARIASDLEWARGQTGGGQATVICTDCRCALQQMEGSSVAACITSPPYLNNLDYAEITRLDTTFFGLIGDWAELNRRVRAELVTSATTQVRRDLGSPATLISERILKVAPDVYENLARKVAALEGARAARSAGKSFDIVVACYFSEMCEVMRQLHRVLTPGGNLVMTVGDSCLYDVYLPTDIYLAQIGMGLGFSSFTVEKLRERGDKWTGLPHRHNRRLRETIVILRK